MGHHGSDPPMRCSFQADAELHSTRRTRTQYLPTQGGALMIVPASLVLRFMMPCAVGWGHVGATALVTIVATFVFTMLILSRYVPA